MRHALAVSLSIALLFGTLATTAVAQDPLAPIRERLESPEVWDRIQGVRDLIRSGIEPAKARPLLEKLSGDVDPDVRGEVVWAVFEMLGADGTDLLEKLYSDPDRRVRDSAIRASCRLWDEREPRDLCSAAFDDPDYGARIEVLNTLREHFPRDPKAAEIFRRGLGDVSEMVQRSSVLGAQAARDEKAVPLLAKIARTSSDLSAVPAAEEALATIANDEAVDVLVSLLPEPEPKPDQRIVRPSDLVRAASARALARVKSPKAIPALRQVVDDPSLPVRLGAMEALMQLRDEGSVDAISKQLADDSDRVRKVALRALRNIGDPACADEVRKVLRDDKDENVRATAAITIADLLGEESIDDLAALRGDLSPTVRLEAASALAGIGSAGTDALVKFLDDSNDSVQLMALQGLSQIGDARHVPAIAALADKKGAKHAQLRVQVADALGQIGHASAVPHLVELAEDPEPRVRQQAARALGRIGGSEADQALEALLKDPVSSVRSEARRAKSGGK
jgi:HEAT repeat protein